MKTVVFGDIHGRVQWKEIVEQESPDKVIFLGDYVSTHELISSEQQWENMNEILELPDEFAIRLRGNHDVQHLGYYWAECSGFDKYIFDKMSVPEFVDYFLEKTQWIHQEKIGGTQYLFSHAGISQTWFDDMKQYGKIMYDLAGEVNNNDVLNFINEQDPCEKFGFTPSSYFDYSGDSKTQPLTWIRPQSLASDMLGGYGQIVGHTPVNKITNVKQACKNKQDLWLCDRMPLQYLIIEDDVIKVGGQKL